MGEVTDRYTAYDDAALHVLWEHAESGGAGLGPSEIAVRSIRLPRQAMGAILYRLLARDLVSMFQPTPNKSRAFKARPAPVYTITELGIQTYLAHRQGVKS